MSNSKHEWCPHMSRGVVSIPYEDSLWWAEGWIYTDPYNKRSSAEPYLKCPTCGKDRNWWVREQEAKRNFGTVKIQASYDGVKWHDADDGRYIRMVYNTGGNTVYTHALLKKMYPGRGKR